MATVKIPIMTEIIPNPGSDEAQSRGCKCPVLDNGFGRGAFIDAKGEPQFWINKDCPLHGKEATCQKN